MRRASLTVLIAVAFLCAPGSALAGTPFTWAMPHDFTTAGSGANPDTDAYGNTPWRYLSSTGALRFSPSFGGGLAGWSDDPNNPSAYIAVKPGSPPQLQMLPAMGGSVSIRWTSPYAFPVTASVTGSATQLNPGLPCLPTDVTATLNGSQRLTHPSVTVPAKGTLTLKLADTSVRYSARCDLVAATLKIQVTATAPFLTIASPSPGATVAEPFGFRGSAADGFPFASAVSVSVYSGSSATGTPLTTTSTTETTGVWSVASTVLPAGTYTAQAYQSDAAGNRWASGAVTFTIPAAPTVTLNSPGAAPLLTSTPTLTGTAGTDPGDSNTVFVAIFSGSGASAREVQLLSTPVGSGGSFSVQVSPSLPDGQYTAIAGQNGPGAPGESNPQTFSIKVNAPALTLTSPAAGADTTETEPQFSGAAGNVFGDSPQVSVTLYSGESAHGHKLGQMTVTRSDATWSARWSHTLSPGFYTVTASQSDNAGHTTVTKGATFLVVPASSLIGSTVRLSRAGVVTLAIACKEPSGRTCSGSVLILTLKRYRPVRGGPSGRLRLLFAYVRIDAGTTLTVSRQLSSEVRHALRGRHKVKLSVATTISISGGPTQSASVIRRLRQH